MSQAARQVSGQVQQRFRRVRVTDSGSRSVEVLVDGSVGSPLAHEPRVDVLILDVLRDLWEQALFRCRAHHVKQQGGGRRGEKEAGEEGERETERERQIDNCEMEAIRREGRGDRERGILRSACAFT